MDALSTYEPKEDSVWLKFKDGDEVKLRVLTLDPLVTEKEWPNSPGKLDTKYAFIVWNWTANKAQVWQVGPGLLNRFTRIHRDEDFDPLNKVDIKVSATGEMLERRYEVQVMPKANELTPDMVNEAKNLDLEKLIPDNRGRLSEYDEGEAAPQETSGYEKAKAQRDKLANKEPDTVAEVSDEEPVDLDVIPF